MSIDVEKVKQLTKELNAQLTMLQKNCTTCEEFDNTKEVCKKFNQRPPARIIAYGCEHWYDIPF